MSLVPPVSLLVGFPEYATQEGIMQGETCRFALGLTLGMPEQPVLVGS